MLVFEFKAYGNKSQFAAVDEAIRTAQFVRNSCLRYWMDNRKIDKYDLNKYCAVLASEFPFADQLNSQARQASAERAWSAISRFYENCKKGIPGKKGYPQFQKDCRCVEYKSTGWKLAENRKTINFTDKKGIGRLKLKGTRDLHFYQITQIKRVRLVKRASGIYVQFCVDADRKENIEPSGNTIGLDVGLKEYYTDSKAVNPQYTSQECSSCGVIVKKTLSTRTHVCRCGCSLDRDENAARNILSRGLSTVGHTGTFGLEPSNALGELTSTLAGEILSKQVGS
jgi:putative transposase